MKTFVIDQECVPLFKGLSEALVAEKQTAYIHIVVVHTKKWWCVYVSIPVDTPKREVYATLLNVEKALTKLHSAGLVNPYKDGPERKSLGPAERGQEYNFEFWLPQGSLVPDDFRAFYPRLPSTQSI